MQLHVQGRERNKLHIDHDYNEKILHPWGKFRCRRQGSNDSLSTSECCSERVKPIWV